ncbi:NAD-binding protein [Hydrogenimonas thermophila]|uniref:NAD-binding protein n=1 Tax=Hydrogenimonas thermophila TaxID=223786 RepID=UPI002936F47D|nr:NAD-binding protein [Hydrogenimonas thermophila]WOE68731.1 NAD-binding protein [Hydrogenimonas thermophila]WOE71241.1 NAD-binding protein [Hydrogenimonas thermophila]
MYGLKQESREIILFGFGKLGHRIYEMLTSNFSKITVADNREDIINDAKEYGIDSAFYIDLVDDSKLEELGLDNKILFCAMDEMSLNIFLVLSLKTISSNSTIISVSTSSESTRKLKFIGADKVIDLYESSANRIVDIITRPAVTKVLDEIIYIDNEIRIEEIEIPPKSFLEDKYVSDIDFREFGLILIGITDKELGDDFTFVSRGINHKFDEGDILVLLGESQALEDFYTLLMGQIDE